MPLADIDIVADLFRLARTEQYETGAKLLAAAEDLYPEEDPERLKSCMRTLADTLWNTDHGGYATEYKRDARAGRSRPRSEPCDGPSGPD